MNAIEIIAMINALPEQEKKLLSHMARTTAEGVAAFQVVNHGTSSTNAR